VADFIKKHPSDIIVWINPISPLQTEDEIKEVIEYFKWKNLDSLITVNNNQVHCIYQENPVNFIESEKFSQTQDLESVQPLVYSVMMWDSKVFIENFKKKGHAILCGKVGYFPVSKLSGMIIKTEQDLRLVECIMKSRNDKSQILYDKLVDKI
jgi:CMP-N-acetylneuraminic acid synthetase